MADEETLDQRRWTERRKFRIADDGVRVSYSQLLSTQQFRIPFENIPTDTIETTKRHLIWLVCALVFLGFSVLGITANLVKDQPAAAAQTGAVWGALSLFSGLAFVFTRQRLIAFATGDASLVFYASSPSEEAVSKFMTAVIRARDAYLRARYQRPTAGESPIDAIERLNALRERQVISQEEFDSLKAAIVNASVGPKIEGSGGTYL